MKKRSKRVSLLAFFAFIQWSGGLTWAVNPEDNPIVLIPGILGSQLWAKLNRTSVPHPYCSKDADWFNLWLSIEELLYPLVNCAGDNTMLMFNNETKEFVNQEGVDIEVRDFGGTDTIEYLDPSFVKKIEDTTNYFHAMVDHFVGKGYVRKETIRGAPYDWRLAPKSLVENGYFGALKKLIEDAYNSYKNPVTIVTHSMGGPVSLYFLTQVVDQQWKDLYLKQFITIAAVWGGAGKSIRSIVSGDNEGIFIDLPIWGRSSQRTYPATYFLLPPAGDLWSRDDVLVTTPTRNYTAYDYKDLFDKAGYPIGWDIYREIMDNTRHFPPPMVTTYCFYGLGKKTPLQFHYSSTEFPDSPPDVTYGDGDGTVNIKSLEVCKRWITQQKYKVYSRSFSDVEHVHTVKNKSIIEAVSDVIFSS